MNGDAINLPTAVGNKLATFEGSPLAGKDASRGQGCPTDPADLPEGITHVGNLVIGSGHCLDQEANYHSTRAQGEELETYPVTYKNNGVRPGYYFLAAPTVTEAATSNQTLGPTQYTIDLTSTTHLTRAQVDITAIYSVTNVEGFTLLIEVGNPTDGWRIIYNEGFAYMEGYPGGVSTWFIEDKFVAVFRGAHTQQLRVTVTSAAGGNWAGLIVAVTNRKVTLPATPAGFYLVKYASGAQNRGSWTAFRDSSSRRADAWRLFDRVTRYMLTVPAPESAELRWPANLTVTNSDNRESNGSVVALFYGDASDPTRVTLGNVPYQAGYLRKETLANDQAFGYRGPNGFWGVPSNYNMPAPNGPLTGEYATGLGASGVAKLTHIWEVFYHDGTGPLCAAYAPHSNQIGTTSLKTGVEYSMTDAFSDDPLTLAVYQVAPEALVFAQSVPPSWNPINGSFGSSTEIGFATEYEIVVAVTTRLPLPLLWAQCTVPGATIYPGRRLPAGQGCLLQSYYFPITTQSPAPDFTATFKFFGDDDAATELADWQLTMDFAPEISHVGARDTVFPGLSRPQGPHTPAKGVRFYVYKTTVVGNVRTWYLTVFAKNTGNANLRDVAPREFQSGPDITNFRLYNTTNAPIYTAPGQKIRSLNGVNIFEVVKNGFLFDTPASQTSAIFRIRLDDSGYHSTWLEYTVKA